MEEFEIKGTLEGIQNILEEDFDMSEDESKFFVYILINQDRTSELEKKEINNWYFFNNEEKYTGQQQILDTHYVISFTDLKKELCHKAYIFLSGFFFNKGFNILQFGFDLLYIVYNAMKHIGDEDFCVFSRIIELNIGNNGRLFGIDDIKTSNKDCKCDFQDENWRCPELREYDECINNKEKIMLTFSRLEDQHVIKKAGNFWVLQ